MKLFKPAFERDPRWILSTWRNQHEEQSRHYTAVQCLKQMRARIGQEALQQLKTVPIPQGIDPHDVTAVSGELVDRIRRFHLGSELPAIDSLIRLAETDEYRAIAAEIEPLLSAAAALDAKEEAARLARQQKEGALQQAREEAKQRALKRADLDPAVLHAEKELAELQSAESQAGA
jgi:hypothetical protein